MSGDRAGSSKPVEGKPAAAPGEERPEGAAQASMRAVPKCPICGKARDDHYRPFCSKRCADVDLGRWLHGSYAIPVTDDSDEDGEAADASAPRQDAETGG